MSHFVRVKNYLNSLEVNYAFVLEPGVEYRDIDVFVKLNDLKKIVSFIVEKEKEKGFELYNFIEESYVVQLYFSNDELGENYNVDLMLNMSFRGVPFFTGDILEEESFSVCWEGGKYLSSAYLASYLIVRDLLQTGGLVAKTLEKVKKLTPVDRKLLEEVVKERVGVDFEPSISGGRRLRIMFFLRRLLQAPLLTTVGFLSNLLFKIKRMFSYPGLMVAFLGPDGAGKSSVLSAVKKSSLLRNVSEYYLLPGWFKRYRSELNSGVVVTEPHSRPPRSFPVSMLKATVFLVEYVMGYAKIINNRLVKGELVVFDRYFSDMLVDQRRYRYGGPVSILKIISNFIPSPDLTFVLCAPAEVIQSRKQEVSFQETERQLLLYRKYAEDKEDRIVINTDRGLGCVVDDVRSQMVLLLHVRAMNRYEKFLES